MQRSRFAIPRSNVAGIHRRRDHLAGQADAGSFDLLAELNGRTDWSEAQIPSSSQRDTAEECPSNQPALPSSCRSFE